MINNKQKSLIVYDKKDSGPSKMTAGKQVGMTDQWKLRHNYDLAANFSLRRRNAG